MKILAPIGGLVLFLAGLLAPPGIGPAAAQSEDAVFNFAKELYDAGDYPFAILEFKRFAYQYPQSQRAPEALYWVATIYADVLKASDKAVAELQRLERNYPYSPYAVRAAGRREEIQKQQAKTVAPQPAPPAPAPPPAKVAYRRAYSDSLVPRYEVIQEDFAPGQAKADYVVILNLMEIVREDQLRAALDKAIAAAQGRVGRAQQRLIARAYFNYPDKFLGEGVWEYGAERAAMRLEATPDGVYRPRGGIGELLDILLKKQ